MRILQLSTCDISGGAERVAFDLHRAYRELRHDARLLVGRKVGSTGGVEEVDYYSHASAWAPLLKGLDFAISQQRSFRGQHHLRVWLRNLALAQRGIDRRKGIEDLNYPYSWHLLDDPEWRPDVIHAHNLHGDYFDLRALSTLSRRVPVILTLHDAWTFTGHCAYFIDCPRWRTGCGDCPDLRRHPPVARDSTAINWKQKRDVYAASRLTVVTPSRWLADCARQSMLKPESIRVIPYGIDPTIYRPDDQDSVRSILGLPGDAFVMFTAIAAGYNPYKDFSTILNAVKELHSQKTPRPILLISAGGTARESYDPPVRYLGPVLEPQRMALFLQAADVFLHAAQADNFPLSVLEAMACGKPVIATAVGGIPEEVQPGVNAILVPRGDSRAMAESIRALMENPDRRLRMGLAAASWAQERFSPDRQVQAYLSLYENLVRRPELALNAER